LVVYYSLTGNTRRVAEVLAKELGADVEELRCARYRVGLRVFFRATFYSWSGGLPPIEHLSHDPSKYDLEMPLLHHVIA
jgi:hypothetical protein